MDFTAWDNPESMRQELVRRREDLPKRKNLRPQFVPTPLRPHRVPTPLLVVAIDFGTTYSGYAFSFSHEKQDIKLNQWTEAGMGGQMKTPTCLLLHPDKTVHSFGHEAKTHYETLTNLQQHKEWYFFWEFKMSLHSQKEIRGTYRIKEEGGKLMDATTVFSLSIRWIKNHLMQIIHNFKAGLKEDEIRWVLTVPAIWKDSAKKFMKNAAEKSQLTMRKLALVHLRKRPSRLARAVRICGEHLLTVYKSFLPKPDLASKFQDAKDVNRKVATGVVPVDLHRLIRDDIKAGIGRDNLQIALEPEAASLFCQQLEITRDPQGAATFQRFPKGTKYMILDCGGGTVDVTVHEVLKDGMLKELHSANGGHWGGTKVNQSFVKFISTIVGEDNFKKFCDDHKGEYMALLGEFETKKRMTKPGSVTPVTIRIAVPLQEPLKHGLSSNTSTDKSFRGRLGMIGDKLRIEPADFESFFQDTTSQIVSHVKELLEFIPGPIKFILMVGGFSDSPVLQKSIKDAFKDKVDVVIPTDASLCVMKGAVLNGHDPNKITSRKVPFTYGLAMTKPFDSRTHPKRKKITIDNEDLCDDLFDKHVEIGEEAKTGEVKKTKTYFPLSDRDTLLPVILYRSSSKNPTFIDDAGCDRVGTFLVKVNPNIGKTYRDRPLEVGILFGNADIVVKATEKDGSTHRAEFRMES